MPALTSALREESLFTRILGNAERLGNRESLVFLDRGETVSGAMGYEALVVGAARAASRLADEGLAHRPVVIALPAGLSFATMFLACLWMRAIAVPAAFPSLPQARQRLLSTCHDARPAAIITNAEGAQTLNGEKTAPRLLLAENVIASGGQEVAPAEGPASDIALLQYTSGSTREPRGIAISHGNLLANQLMIMRAFGHDETLIGANWLPHFHDMGLLGAILQAIYVGGKAVLFDPMAFVQKPLRWLKAIDRFKATTAGGPCFAYDLCTRRCGEEEAASLDLSSWRVAFCGAEPIRRAVLENFAQRFAPSRFTPSSFLPCYGLAEATLIVSCTPRGAAFKSAKISSTADGPSITALSCGPAVEGCSIEIRADDGTPITDGEVGEIWVGGPHVSPGIWNGEAQRAEAFDQPSHGEGGLPFIATGDVGALVDGELVPAGRIKDTVIVYGQKLHAADIEARLLDDPQSEDILAACAFSLDEVAKPELIILCEAGHRRLRDLQAGSGARHLAEVIADAYGVLPTIRYLPHGSLPRTSSGKVQRFNCKMFYLSGRFDSRCARASPMGAYHPS